MIISLQAIENEKVTRISMEKYHIPYEIIVGKGMCHCYPLLRFFREGREAQDEIIELLKQ